MVGKTLSRSVTEIAEAEKISKSYVSRILRLTLLVPDLVEAIIGGWADERVMLDMLERPLPMGWGSSVGRLPGHACLTSPLFVCPACLGPTALPGEMVDAVEGMGIIGDRAAIGERLHARLERWQAWIILKPLGAERG